MSQSIKCILVGNNSKSDGQLFYVPYTRSILGTSDYKLDPIHPSGPMFQLNYNGGIQFNSHVPNSTDMRPPAFTIEHQVTIININNDKKIATIVDIPFNNSIVYTINIIIMILYIKFHKNTSHISINHTSSLHLPTMPIIISDD